MRIRTKLIGGLVLLISLSGSVGLVSFLTNRSINADLLQITQSSFDEAKSAAEMALAIESAHSATEELIAETYRGIVEPDEKVEADEAASRAKEEIGESLDEFEQWLALGRAATERGIAQARAGGEEDEAAEEQEELVQMDSLEAEFELYKSEITRYITLIDTDLADADEFLQEVLEKEYRNKILAAVKDVEEDALEELVVEIAEVQAAAARANTVIAILTLVIFFFATGLGLLLTTSISRGISQTRNAAVKIAKGSLDTTIAIDGDDELTELAQALETMRKSLKSALETTQEENVTLTTVLKERERAEKLLKEKIAELENFQRLTIGRELKMIDLKEQIEKQKRSKGTKNNSKGQAPPSSSPQAG